MENLQFLENGFDSWSENDRSLSFEQAKWLYANWDSDKNVLCAEFNAKFGLSFSPDELFVEFLSIRNFFDEKRYVTHLDFDDNILWGDILNCRLKNMVTRAFEQTLISFLKEHDFPGTAFQAGMTECFFSTVDGEDYLIAEIYGGKNGGGKYSDYFKDLGVLCGSIESWEFVSKCWLLNFSNDLADDVFVVYLGIRFI